MAGGARGASALSGESRAQTTTINWKQGHSGVPHTADPITLSGSLEGPPQISRVTGTDARPPPALCRWVRRKPLGRVASRKHERNPPKSQQSCKGDRLAWCFLEGAPATFPNLLPWELLAGWPGSPLEAGWRCLERNWFGHLFGQVALVAS